ncbi:GGDEF domain-containing protein [Candidatus Fermentibacterales bacterium]|nr:GGDEF domain-containing protein [Candidatus Fermentibacterales bacterium]
MTGLPPRMDLDEDLPMLLRAMGAERMPMSAIMVDIDHFKAFNDKWGHEVGDVVLLHVATLIRSAVRYRGEAYRYGGEEMTVLLPNCGSLEALATAERLCRLVRDSPLDLAEAPAGSRRREARPAPSGSMLFGTARRVSGAGEADRQPGEDPASRNAPTVPLSVMISLGVSTFPSVSGDELLVAADKALYRAKQLGRNQAVLFEGGKGEREETVWLEVRIPEAANVVEGSYVILARWFSHGGDPTDIEAREISDPGRGTRMMADGPLPPGGLVTSEVRGRVGKVERRGSSTFFSFEVEESQFELMIHHLEARKL